MTPAELKALVEWRRDPQCNYDTIHRSNFCNKCWRTHPAGSSRRGVIENDALPALIRLWEAAERAMGDAPIPLKPDHFYKVESNDLIPLEASLRELLEMKL